MEWGCGAPWLGISVYPSETEFSWLPRYGLSSACPRFEAILASCSRSRENSRATLWYPRTISRGSWHHPELVFQGSPGVCRQFSEEQWPALLIILYTVCWRLPWLMDSNMIRLLEAQMLSPMSSPVTRLFSGLMGTLLPCFYRVGL